MITPTPLISFQNVCKSFGNVRANHEITFDIRSGSFHGVVGENGAGKSTIMRILYGLHAPDSGSIYFRGEPILFKTPDEAISRGIGMVHQHFMLVPSFTVWENIVLGQEPSGWLFNKQRFQNAIADLQSEFGFHLPLDKPVEQLSIGERQQVEILKLLYRKADVLILDEPSALLSPEESSQLYRRLKQFQQQGKTIVLVTHKLQDILTFCDRVTVMRTGTVVSTQPTVELSDSSLAQLIMGRQPKALSKLSLPQSSPTVLSLSNVSTHHHAGMPLHQLSFVVKKHEVVGIAGIEGQGQEALVQVLAQILPSEGSILLDQKPLRSRSMYVQKQNGLGLIPPSRHDEGLVLSFSAAENLILGHHREPIFCKGSFIQTAQVGKYAKKQFETFDIRPTDFNLPASAFSGGNQQKLIVARESQPPLSLLVATHPTRGVDIGASEMIHEHLLHLAAEGTGILLISSDLEELLLLSHRILVIREGTIVFEQLSSKVSFETLGLWMTGANRR